MRRVPQSRRETNIPDSLPLEPVFLYNPLVCGRDRSMSACGSRTPDLKKKKTNSRSICVLFSSAALVRAGAGSHTAEKAQLETDRGIGPNQKHDKDGGDRATRTITAPWLKHRGLIYVTARRAGTISEQHYR